MCRIADNLPVATRLEFFPVGGPRDTGEPKEEDEQKDVQFEHGYRLGFVANSKVHQPIHPME